MSIRDSVQINIRVSTEVEEVLEAAAFVRKYRGMQKLLGPIVGEYAASLAKEEAVQAALRARKQRARDE